MNDNKKKFILKIKNKKNFDFLMTFIIVIMYYCQIIIIVVVIVH